MVYKIWKFFQKLELLDKIKGPKLVLLKLLNFGYKILKEN